jgi:hypothetical protein
MVTLILCRSRLGTGGFDPGPETQEVEVPVAVHVYVCLCVGPHVCPCARECMCVTLISFTALQSLSQEPLGPGH